MRFVHLRMGSGVPILNLVHAIDVRRAIETAFERIGPGPIRGIERRFDDGLESWHWANGVLTAIPNGTAIDAYAQRIWKWYAGEQAGMDRVLNTLHVSDELREANEDSPGMLEDMVAMAWGPLSRAGIPLPPKR